MARGDLEPGSLVGDRYEVMEEVGAGGMGTVYRVIDTLLGNKEIALKTLRDEYAREKSYVQRFIREIELMNQVNHPNVVRTFDIGTDGELIFFTMEFVKGISLDEILERGPMPLEDIPLMLIQVCRGLQAIHRAEIIHRDLKPGNIIVLEDETVKIADFGVARPKFSQLTRENERVGSIWYMAPEVWEGSDLSRATDLYSVGVLMFEATTGRLPFDSDEPGQLMRMHMRRQAPSPKKYRQDMPDWLEQITLKLLSKSPKDRPKTAREVIDMIKLHSSGTHPAFNSGRHPVYDESEQEERKKSIQSARMSGIQKTASAATKSRPTRRSEALSSSSRLTPVLLSLILLVLVLLLVTQVMQVMQ